MTFLMSGIGINATYRDAALRQYKSYLSVMTGDAVSSSTAALLQLCEDSAWNPHLDALRECVQQSADITVKVHSSSTNNHQPLLSRLIEEGRLEAVKVCLTSPEPVDFTVQDSFLNTPMHAAVEVNIGPEEYNRLVVEAVVYRLSSFPLDVADWSLRNGCDLDFISFAAENQLLSTLWPEVQSVAYFADKEGGIPLAGRVWQWDWDTLTPQDQDCFRTLPTTRFFAVDAPTARLCRLSQQQSPVDVELVRHLIHDSEVDCTVRLDGALVLSRFLDGGQLEAVKVCLETPLLIDFTVTDIMSETPLHAVAQACTGSDRYNQEAMRALVQRIQHGPPSARTHQGVSVASERRDPVQWLKKNDKGLHFLALAAKHQLLSLFWEEIKDVPFFAARAALLVEGDEHHRHFARQSASLAPHFFTSLRFPHRPPHATPLNARHVGWHLESATSSNACTGRSRLPDPADYYDSELERDGEWDSLGEVTRTPSPSPAGESSYCTPSDATVSTNYNSMNDVGNPSREKEGEVMEAELSSTVKVDSERGVALLRESGPQSHDFVLPHRHAGEKNQVTRERWQRPHGSEGRPEMQPIPLMGDVWTWDWKRLDATEQHAFDTHHTRFIPADRETARLRKLLQLSPVADMEALRRCVAAGANVLFRAVNNLTCPLLTHCVYSGAVEVVQTMLESPRPIDFTLEDAHGDTPLHRIAADHYRAPACVVQLLHLMINRMETHADTDTVDWGRRNHSGAEPVSLAAEFGFLRIWVQVVLQERRVPYYVQAGQNAAVPSSCGAADRHRTTGGAVEASCATGAVPRIRLTRRVKREEWNGLTEEERGRFEVCGPLI